MVNLKFLRILAENDLQMDTSTTGRIRDILGTVDKDTRESLKLLFEKILSLLDYHDLSDALHDEED